MQYLILELSSYIRIPHPKSDTCHPQHLPRHGSAEQVMVATSWHSHHSSFRYCGEVDNCIQIYFSSLILNYSPPNLQSLCIYSLTNTEAGQAVINIMGIGVDAINVVMASQAGR